MYSDLTIAARTFLRLPVPEGQERLALDKLCGLNELHHTISNQLMRLSSGSDAIPVEVWLRMLEEVAARFKIEHALRAALEFARTRNWQ